MLRFDWTTGIPNDANLDLLAVSVLGRPGAEPWAQGLGRMLGVDLAEWSAEELFDGKAEQMLALSGRDRLPAKRILLVGADPAAPPYLRVRSAAVAALRYALGRNLRRVAFAATDSWGLGLDDWTEAAVVGAETGVYRYARHLTGERRPRTGVDSVRLCLPEGVPLPSTPERRRALARAAALADAMELARDLVNGPANEITPEALAAAARRAARRFDLECTVWGLPEIRRRGLRLLAAVNAGSPNAPARFIRLRYPGRRRGAGRIVLVGKGLTFDSGGLCIKNPKGMEAMKVDMAGGALTIAALAAIGARRPDAEVIGLIPATENMPSGSAMRPGDVVASYGGKTVEILNTDAEGRLILADALGVAVSLKPDVIVDHATLTGACMVALGPHTAGTFANHEPAAAAFLGAAAHTGELYWRLPLADDLREQIRSDVADVKNIGEPYGGAITAALFLQHFVDGIPWIHLDIAGPALGEKPTACAPRGATAFGLPTLLRFVESWSARPPSR